MFLAFDDKTTKRQVTVKRWVDDEATKPPRVPRPTTYNPLLTIPCSRRRGSVLILCVVLIVVLALIGTAMLSTARIDRFTSQQNASNTQIDLLMEGAKAIAKSAVIVDLYDTSGGAGTPPRYRPPTDSFDPNRAGSYDHWDGYTISAGVPPVQNDTWLASLTPKVVIDYVTTPGVADVASAPYWDTITAALVGGTFEDPRDGEPATPVTERIHMVPTIQAIAGRTHPAMLHINATGGLEGPGGGTRPFIAGDADGDGIADSLLSRMLELNGVTYYIAVRIVDDSAKINLNTGRSMTSEFDDDGNRIDMFGNALGIPDFAPNLGAFKSHVGLQEVLWRATPTPAHADSNALAEILQLNEDRFGTGRGSGTLALAGKSVYLDDGTPRTDAEFISAGDAMEHQLGRRLDNPGQNFVTGSAEPVLFRAYTNAAALAYRGGLINPSASRSPVEDAFFTSYMRDTINGSIDNPDSLYRSAPNYTRTTSPQFSPIAGLKAFGPDQVGAWFDYLFNYDRAVGTFSAAGLPGAETPYVNALRIDDQPANPWGLPPEYVPNFFRTLRPLVTTANPVSQQVPMRLTDINGVPGLPGGMSPYRPTPPKTCVNTATLQELWRAYWCVMAEATGSETPFVDATTPPADPSLNPSFFAGMNFDDTNQTTTPSDATNEQHPARMFRNTIRDIRDLGMPRTYMDYEQVVRTRAAMAAGNTIAMRQNPPSAAPPVVDIGAVATVNGAAMTPVNIRIYPMQRQPFLTEVYINTNNRLDPITGQPANLNGYIALELYNPYPDPIDLNGAQIIVIDRRPGTFASPLAMMPVNALGVDAIVPANGYLLIESFSAGTGSGAAYRPASSKLPVTGPIPARLPGQPDLNVVVVDNLHLLLNREMVIQLGPVGAEMNDPANFPIESFDLTGFELPDPLDPNPRAIVLHYARGTGTPLWRWVYPGRYFGDYDVRRQQGMQVATWLPDQGEQDPWQPTTPPPANVLVTLGTDQSGAPVPNTNDAATYDNTFPIQWSVADQAGPNPAGGGINNFPFGGFARDGDILQVPFIAGHRVYRETSLGSGVYETFEINTLSMDAAFAEDTDINTDPPLVAGDNGSTPREQIGRFCPINFVDNMAVPGTADDHSNDISLHRYAWAKDLFDYLTVEAPSFDFLPNVNPDPMASPPYAPEPVPVRNGLPPAATFAAPESEDTLPVHGKININTAPWPVLAAIPWVPYSTAAEADRFTYDDADGTFTVGPNMRDDNIDVAKAIVAWRDGNPAGTAIAANNANGPFKSLFDLYRVVDRTGMMPEDRINIFRAIQQELTGGANEADDEHGDFSPLNTSTPPPPMPTDGVRHDYEEQYLMLNRISNLIATRSDSYTVYILVQGWSGVGTPSPEVVVQRRAAFILDRSPVTAQNSEPAAIKVVND